MKLQADHENKTCIMCLGILCKMCKNVSVKNKEICVDCEVAPLRNQKAHVIYNFLRREGACASIETLRDAYKLLKTAKKNDLRNYDTYCFVIEKIQLRQIFEKDLKKLEAVID